MTHLQFNPEHEVLCDEQGIMLSRDDALALVDKLKKHFAHTPLEMEAIGRRLLAKSHPSMVNQFNYEWFNYHTEPQANAA